jgi:hypothetical protein
MSPRSPHPATVAQPRAAFGDRASRPPHPAAGGARPAAIQRASETKELTARDFTRQLPRLLLDILSKVDLGTVSQLKGGWEGWLQVELAMAAIQVSFDASREANPYETAGLRADLQLVRKNIDVIVEMKCQSVGQKNFENLVLKDIMKLQTLGQGRVGLMVAVVDGTTVAALQAAGFKEVPKALDDMGVWFLYCEVIAN